LGEELETKEREEKVRRRGGEEPCSEKDMKKLAYVSMMMRVFGVGLITISKVKRSFFFGVCG
jgi:hypothetical protein